MLLKNGVSMNLCDGKGRSSFYVDYKRNKYTMNNKNTITITLFLLCLGFIYSCSDRPVDGTYHLELYATNDIHGRYFSSQYTQKNETEDHPYSLATVSAYMRDVRSRIDENFVVLLDIGDNLQGDNASFYSNFIDTTQMHLFAKIVDYMKYDAVVLGNHDIETGHPVYDKVKRELKVPYLAANVVISGTDTPYFEPYTILNKGGIKIAVIGMTNTNTPNWLSKELWSGMEFKEIIPVMERYVKLVKERERPHLIIAAVHSGIGNEDIDDIENSAKYIAKHVAGIDLVFAAHDHRTTAEKVFNGTDSIFLFDGGSRGSSLSFADVTLEIINGKVTSKEIKGAAIPMRDVLVDKEYLAAFYEEFESVKSFTNKVVGKLDKTIYSRDALFGPSDYMGIIHNVQLSNSDTDISLAAPLSYNVTIEAGDLDYQDLMGLYPYENQLFVIELRGKEVKDYLEFSYSKWINKMRSADDHLLLLSISERGARLSGTSYNFDSAAGIVYTVDASKDTGDRISIISMSNGDKFNSEKIYKVALSSYRASGGGDLLVQGAGIPKEQLESRVVERLSDMREIIYRHLYQNGVIEAVNLDNWKIIPEQWSIKAKQNDYNLLFIE